jgi:hypothetical protein
MQFLYGIVELPKDEELNTIAARVVGCFQPHLGWIIVVCRNWVTYKIGGLCLRPALHM